MKDDKLYPDVENSLDKSESPRKKRPGVRAWQQGKKRSRSRVDPFFTLVFLYVIFSVACMLWFGWKYYALKREVARLSGIVVTFSEEKSVGEQASPGLADTTASPDKTGLYTIKDGDYWWKISQDCYGDGTYYIKLTAYNKMEKIPLHKGMVVEIPPREVLDALP